MIGFIKKIIQTRENKTILRLEPELPNTDTSISNEIVEKLTQVWQEILKIETISATDNFFELGGHSILAMNGIVRINEKFEIEMSFKDFMNSPTIALQAELIKTHSKKREGSIPVTKGKVQIKEKFGNEMSVNDSMNSPTISKQAGLIKTPLRNLKSSRFLKGNGHPVNVTKFPLTESQKSLWYLCILNNNSPAYNIPSTIKFTGELDRNILFKTLDYLFKRHNIVFATFHSDEGEPFISINKNQDIIIKEHDLVKFPENELVQKYNEIISADSRLVFNLEKGPLFRLHLLKINKSEWLFHMTIHHLVFDGISYGIFLDEFNSIYNSFKNTEDIKLNDIEIQQYDYAKLLEKNPTQLNSKTIDFWKKYLDGIAAYTNFPLDRSRKKPPSGKGAKLKINVPSDIAKKIITLSNSQNITVFTTMLSAFSLLIKRFSGENDFCIGSPISNRPHQFLEKIFGYFVDTFPIRFTFEGINTFEDLIKYTNSTILNVFEHRNIGIVKIVEIINPERNVLYNSLYQIAFIWPNDLSASIKSEKLEGRRFIIKDGVSPFDITFNMWEYYGDIEGEIEYNIDLFDESTISSISETYIKLLDSVVNNIKENINDLSIVNSNQFNVLKELNNTNIPYRHESFCSILNEINDTGFEIPNKLLHELFIDNVQQFSDKTAVIFEDGLLTYSELNVLSNQLANKLIDDGIVQGDFVGINLAPSLEQIIAVFGVLKSGAGYLPLDPSFPDERLNYILEDSGASYVITQTEKSKFIKIERPLKIFNFNTFKELSSLPKDLKHNIKRDQDSIAYIIYTSGSTGNPKGVLVHHKAVVNFILSMSKIPGIYENDKLLSVTTLSFDISVLEIFLPLSFGATLVIANEEDRISGNLYKLIEKHGITVMQATPATWEMQLISDWKLSSELKALCGGEAMSPRLARELLPKVKELWNMYGPTETTVWSTCKKITNAQPPIQIGIPIGNTQVYILDENRNVLPINVEGEIAIGGEGVSKGYHNREELTKEKFIVKDGQVLYRTGDIGKIKDNGNIEVCGRKDNQIKLRGYRIEPGEIESKLCLFEGIKEAVVKIHQFSENDERMVAFILPEEDFFPDVKEIIFGLKKQLPAYMIPTHFQFQQDFPRTPNGKIDRKEFVYKRNIIQNDDLEFDKSQLNEIEIKLHNIFSEVIRHEKFNLDDNFFDIGGTSLLALKVISRIEKEFDVLIRMRDFLSDYITVRQIGNLINQKNAKKLNSNLDHSEINKNFNYIYCLQSNGNEIPVFGIYCEQLLTENKSLVSRPIYDFTWPGSDGRSFNMHSVEEIAQNYLNEIQRINPKGPYYIIGFSFGGLVAFDIASKLNKSGYQVPSLMLIETNHPTFWESPNLIGLIKEKIKKYGIAKALSIKLFNAAQAHTKLLFKKAKIYIPLKLNKTLPANLRQEMILNEVTKLASKYRPEFYDGEIHIFKSKDNPIKDASLGWRTLAANIKIHELEGRHEDVIRQKDNKITIVKELNKIIKEVE